MSKARSNGFLCEQAVTDDLISGYRASGTKLARTIHRLLYGTREVITDLLTAKGRKHARMAWGDGGRFARSSYETDESQRSEGANMFSFNIFHNLKRNDELSRDKIAANNPIDGLASLLESKSQ